MYFLLPIRFSTLCSGDCSDERLVHIRKVRPQTGQRTLAWACMWHSGCVDCFGGSDTPSPPLVRPTPSHSARQGQADSEQDALHGVIAAVLQLLECSAGTMAFAALFYCCAGGHEGEDHGVPVGDKARDPEIAAGKGLLARYSKGATASSAVPGLVVSRHGGSCLQAQARLRGQGANVEEEE